MELCHIFSDSDRIFPIFVDAFCASSEYVAMYNPGCTSYRIRDDYKKFCLQYCDTSMCNNPESDPINRGSLQLYTTNNENFLDN